MKVLVTGGAGHLGSHVCDLLVEQGHWVTCVDIEGKSHPNRVIRSVDVHLPQASASLLEEFAIVFHLAANANVSETTEYPYRASADGCMLTAGILELARRMHGDCKLVFVSSVLARCGGCIPYAIEKRAGEEYCQHYTKHFGVPTSIIRLNNVYGSPRHKASSGNVIPCLLEQKRTKGRITITGDGSQVRDFVHYTDAVRAIVAAADRDGITECGSCVGRSIKEVAELFDCPIDYVPRPGGEVDRQVCQYSDYPCTVDFESTVRELAGVIEEESSPSPPGQSMAACGRFWGDEG